VSTVLQIRHHPPKSTNIYSVYRGSLAQRSFSLGAFLGQNMALERFGPEDSAGTGFFESFSGGAIGPDLGH
jgi:hypothetical protein